MSGWRCTTRPRPGIRVGPSPQSVGRRFRSRRIRLTQTNGVAAVQGPCFANCSHERKAANARLDDLLIRRSQVRALLGAPVRCARSGPPRQQPAGPSPGGNSCEPALTGQPPALARWAGKAGARSTDSRRVAKWKRQVGYPVTVVRLVAHQPISCLQNAARRAMVSEPNHPAGIVCNALENLQVRLAGRHRLAGRINPCASASSGLPGVAAAVCELCGHSPRCPPRFLSYSTRAPQKPPQKPPGIRAILEVLCELLVSLPHPRQR